MCNLMHRGGLDNLQYGFMKKHSTELAVLEVIDRITNQLDKGQTPMNIYLDLSKAFDTLDHDILINKLQYYGVHASALRLFKKLFNGKKTLCNIQ